MLPIPKANLKAPSSTNCSCFCWNWEKASCSWAVRNGLFLRKTDFEKPTIGILLCETKNDALVELTLPKDANIYAQQYALCLSDKALLQKKLVEWIAEYKEYEKGSR